MTNWPSPFPGPAWAKWRNCCDHLWTVTLAGVSVDLYNVLRKAPAVVQAETRAAELARSGDVLATNSACNAWLRAMQAALKAHTQHKEAA